MKKLIIIPILFFAFKSFSQPTPRVLLGKDISTNMPRFYIDTLRTHFYKPPLYTIGDSIYIDTTRSTYWLNNGTYFWAYPTINTGLGGSTTPHSHVEIATNGITSTTVDSLGITIINNTAATSGVTLQQSGGLRLSGQAWNVGASASQRVDWWVHPVIVNSLSSGLYFSRQFNLGSYSNPAILSSNGDLTLLGILSSASVTTPGSVGASSVSANVSTITTSVLGLSATAASAASALIPVRWSPYIGWISYGYDSSVSAAKGLVFGSEVRPVSLSSNVSGSLYFWYSFNGGAHSDLLQIKSDGRMILKNSINLKSYTVATLPTGNTGDNAYVTDATSPTYLGTLTGGGTVVCPVFYNGTAWVSH